jgi:hypothetical protein
MGATDRVETDDDGIPVVLLKSLCYFDEEAKRDVFIPQGTPGVAYSVRAGKVTVLFRAALVGPAESDPSIFTSVQDEWQTELFPHILALRALSSGESCCSWRPT